ncbi:MAG: phenylacetate--CoA ligase family protein [Pseudomonadota bacterium]
MLKYSLKYSLRSLLRELVRGLPARRLVYPALRASERSAEALAAAVARRCRLLGLAVPPAVSDAGLMSKTDVRTAPQRYLRPRAWGSLVRNRIRTSGSSGQPLTLVQDLGCVIREEAFVHRQLCWMGYQPGQRRAWLRGDVVCDAQPADGRYWCYDWPGRMLMMSSYHLSAATLGAYCAELERYDPAVLHAYPSSVAALAAWLLAEGRVYRGKALLGIMTSSETLDSAVRAQVEAAFGVRVYDWYGQAERVAAIGTCEHGSYHLLTDYSQVELLPAGEDCYELVGTSLNNRAMRLERYRTGDLVRLAAAPCACGRVFPALHSVVGRKEQVLQLADGRLIGRLDHVFKGAERVLEGQIVYHGSAGFELRVVPAAGYGAADAAALVAAFLERVPAVPVRVEAVAAIARGANGKFEFICVAGDAAGAP